MTMDPREVSRRAELLDRIVTNIGDQMKSALPGDVGFVLVMFDGNAGGGFHFATNGSRAETVDALRNAASRLESYKKG